MLKICDIFDILQIPSVKSTYPFHIEPQIKNIMYLIINIKNIVIIYILPLSLRRGRVRVLCGSRQEVLEFIEVDEGADGAAVGTRQGSRGQLTLLPIIHLRLRPHFPSHAGLGSEPELKMEIARSCFQFQF